MFRLHIFKKVFFKDSELFLKSIALKISTSLLYKKRSVEKGTVVGKKGHNPY